MTTVSIIMPVLNSAPWLKTSMDSVLGQDYQDWELLVVDNGSLDESVEIAKEYTDDPRIRIYREKRKGVSAARNKGLEHAKGAFICFLDADDRLPKKSLSSRVEVFKRDEKIQFADGRVGSYIEDFDTMKGIWTPAFSGPPERELALMTGTCFCGITWMIKTESIGNHRFPTTQSHAEDLSFYLAISKGGGLYDYTEEVVYDIRHRPHSAMSDLDGLHLGYKLVAQQISHLHPAVQAAYKKKVRRIMTRSYLKDRQWRNAWQSFFNAL